MGWIRYTSLVLAGFHLLAAHGFDQDTNFQATFGRNPAPFQIDVDTEFIAQTKQRVALTRFPVDIDQPELAEGPPVHNATAIRNYWVDHYDWFEVQESLNKK